MSDINYGVFIIGLVIPIVAIGLAILYVDRGGVSYLNELISEFCKYARFPKFSGYKKHHISIREDGTPLIFINGIAGDVIVIDTKEIERSNYNHYLVIQEPIMVKQDNNLYCKAGVNIYGRILINELK